MSTAGLTTVRTRVGDVPGRQSLTETVYLRGMHGDKAAPAGGTRTVTTRERIVGSNAPGSLDVRMIVVSAGGSSSNLRNALAA